MTALPITEERVGQVLARLKRDPMPYTQAAFHLVEDLWHELEDWRRPRTPTRKPLPGETPLPLEVPCG